MRRYLWIPLFSLALTAQVYGEGVESTTVESLVSASPSEIADRQEDAQRKREAFAKLLEDVLEEEASPETPDAEATTGDTNAGDEITNAQGFQTEPREGEASVALVPTERAPADNPRRFARLKKTYAGALDSPTLRDDLRAFLVDHPDHREARLLLGRIYILSGDYPEAIRALDPLVTSLKRSAHPDWQPWFWAGTAYLAARDMGAAREHFDIAVEKNSAAVEVWVQLAVLEQEMNNHAGALQYMAIAEQLDANYGEIYLNRGYSLEHLGRYEEAVRAYRRFLVAPQGHTTRGLRPTVLRRISEIAGTYRLAEGAG